MTKEQIDVKNIANGWIPCTDDTYPSESSDCVIIAFKNEDATYPKWYYYTRETCPYGWNVLCRNNAYFKELKSPI